MSMLQICLMGLLLTSFFIPSLAQQTIHFLPKESEKDTRMEYYQKLLALALEKTKDSHGAYKLVPTEKGMTQVQAMKNLIQNKGLDIVHSMTDKGRERVLRPIRIPLDKGLIGMRLLMVKENQATRYLRISEKAGLESIVFGQGADWPDTEILQFNKLKVKKSSDYSSLFTMLDQGQIDAFPRAVFEIYDELDANAGKGFAVAPNVLIKYPAAMYFFVRQADKALAERIETGLSLAIKDGSFDTLFNRYMMPYLQKANVEQRIQIELNNPLLPENTPLERKELWYLR